MTLPAEATATCPGCGAEFAAEVFASVNVTVNPELKRRVLDGSLFDHDCPKCGKLSRFGHGLLYHDMERRVQVDLRPEGDPPTAAAVELAGIMLDGPIGEGYRLRWVVEGFELAEKVRILDARLDDRLVELLKVWTLAGSEDVRSKPLLFYGLSRDAIEFVTPSGDVVPVAFERYEALREQFAAKLKPDHGWQRIDRAFALGVLGLGPRVADRPATGDAAHAELVKAEASGRAIIGVDRVYARRLFTDAPAAAVERATGEAPYGEKAIVLGFFWGSPLALLASIVAGAFAFGWISAAVSVVFFVFWFVNRGLSCGGNSSAWPATFLLAGAVVAHVMHASADPWVTGFAMLAAFALWCDRMLYASATLFLRAYVLRNPRALGAFAEGLSVRRLG